MYRLTCYTRNDTQVYQKEFDSREAVTSYFESELEADLGDSTSSYTYELEQRSDWTRIPFKLKVDF